MITKAQLRKKRHNRVRKSITGTQVRPRLIVYRSNSRLYAQIIDDTKGVTLASAAGEGKNIQTATNMGAQLAQVAQEKKIVTVVFDRGGYRYHGRIKALADALRAGGLKF